MPVCAHCGELFPDGRLNCPHCGMDADQGWTPDPEYGEFEPEDGDAEYRAFLEREGLATPEKPRGKGGCGPIVLLGILICATLSVLI